MMWIGLDGMGGIGSLYTDWIGRDGSLYTDNGFQMPIMKSLGPVTESKESVIIPTH